MVGVERYATTWHGLFPRFLAAGFALALMSFLLQRTIYALIPVGVNFTQGLPLTYEVYDIVSVAFFPFAAFALFYLSSRVRIDLGKDFGSVAASAFLGALAGFLFYGVPIAIQGNPGTGVVDVLLQSTASAVYEAIEYAFVGFAAVLLSYRRRI